MRTDRQKNILTDCMDIIALAGFMRNRKERVEMAQTLINELCNYPFISARMGDKVIWVYLKVDCARNVLRAYTCNYVPFHVAFASAKKDIEIAFSILTDK